MLLHPTSLPSAYGVGELGDHAIELLDWLASAGMRIWQVLPLNPPGFGTSPYGCLSAFAGNPMLISIQRLLEDGLLDAADAGDGPGFSNDHLDLDRVQPFKAALLRRSWRRFEEQAPPALRAELQAFVSAPEQREWLDDYTLFMALKEHSGGQPWWLWSDGLMKRKRPTIERARLGQRAAIRFWEYVQFLFFRQWTAVREAAHARGIRIMGDVPIYVAGDSADVWAHRQLFQLDEHGQPTVVAGVPPDYFSAIGQRWGNPLYRWDLMHETRYRWWVERVRANLRTADVVRLDHFRGFAAYWEIPASEETAVHGRWMPGPGLALFEAIRRDLGDLPLVAEDLGYITEDVHALRRAAGLPGMRVLQFGFGENDSPHLPHRFEPHTVVYTGTHDNDTARGWFDRAGAEERNNAAAYLGCTNAEEIAPGLIRAAYTSVAEMAIVPIQDILGLGNEARMNTPGEEEHNWTWRLPPGTLRSEHATRLRTLARLTGRAGQ